MQTGGDEGKGKITDMLAQEADIIVRFQGGANAGHTIIIIMENLRFTHYHPCVLWTYNKYYR